MNEKEIIFPLIFCDKSSNEQAKTIIRKRIIKTGDIIRLTGMLHYE